MQPSSGRFAPTSSVRTPTRAGFGQVLVCQLYAHILYFAAPVVGASPDNIGAQRLAEGGVPAGGAGSAKVVTNTINSLHTIDEKANAAPQSTAAH